MIMGRLTFEGFFVNLRGWAKHLHFMHYIYHNISSIIHFESSLELDQRKFHKCRCSTAKWPGCYKHTRDNIWKWPCGHDTGCQGQTLHGSSTAPSLPDLALLVGLQLLVKHQGLHWLSVAQQYSLCCFLNLPPPGRFKKVRSRVQWATL